MAATATGEFVTAVVAELREAANRLSNPLYRRALENSRSAG